jgi:hypothetical protein
MLWKMLVHGEVVRGGAAFTREEDGDLRPNLAEIDNTGGLRRCAWMGWSYGRGELGGDKETVINFAGKLKAVGGRRWWNRGERRWRPMRLK